MYGLLFSSYSMI